MKNVRNDRPKQINDIVSVVKLSTLLIMGIILCKNFIKKNSLIWAPETYYTIICLFVPLMILILIYLAWAFSTKNKIKNKYGNMLNKIEITMFITVFSIIILMCGVNQSECKFLYLFVILTSVFLLQALF